MAMRTGKVGAGEAEFIERQSFVVEARRQESFGRCFSEQRVAAQRIMNCDVQDVSRVETQPAGRALERALVGKRGGRVALEILPGHVDLLGRFRRGRSGRRGDRDADRHGLGSVGLRGRRRGNRREIGFRFLFGKDHRGDHLGGGIDEYGPALVFPFDIDVREIVVGKGEVIRRGFAAAVVAEFIPEILQMKPGFHAHGADGGAVVASVLAGDAAEVQRGHGAVARLGHGVLQEPLGVIQSRKPGLEILAAAQGDEMSAHLHCVILAQRELGVVDGLAVDEELGAGALVGQADAEALEQLEIAHHPLLAVAQVQIRARSAADGEGVLVRQGMGSRNTVVDGPGNFFRQRRHEFKGVSARQEGRTETVAGQGEGGGAEWVPRGGRTLNVQI